MEPMANKQPSKKGPRMAVPTSATRRKSAEDKLLEDFGELIDSAAKKMPHEEFMKAANHAKETLDQAIAAHSRRRGTA